MNVPQSLLASLRLAASSKLAVWPLVTPVLALAVPAIDREILFQNNLFDLERDHGRAPRAPEAKTARAADGTRNDLAHPAYGAVDVRLGRNVNPATLPARARRRDPRPPAQAGVPTGVGNTSPRRQSPSEAALQTCTYFSFLAQMNSSTCSNSGLMRQGPKLKQK